MIQAQKSRRAIAILTVICMILTFMPMSVQAAETDVVAVEASAPTFTDISGHWGQTAIEKWSGQGIINGYNGFFRPDDSITRGEMAVILDNLMDYQVAAGNTFTDLKVGQFYTDAILKSNASGIILGDGVTVRPLDKITREEAAVMLSRALAVPKSSSAMTFSDASSVSAWAKNDVAGMAVKGYVNGFAGKFDPKANVTRAAVVTMINNIIKVYYTQAGTYTENVAGTAVIKVPGVILKGVTIDGNLIIAEGVGQGDATLDSVTVKGETVVRGGGENSIHIIGTSSITSIRIEKIGDTLRIVIADGLSVQVVEVAAGEEIIITGTVGTLELSVEGATVYATAADINTASINGANSTIIVGGQSAIGSILVGSTAGNTTIQTETGGWVEVIEASAPIIVSGPGTVSEVELNAGASGSTITSPNTVVSVGDNVTGVTGTGGTAIPAGETGTNASIPTAPAIIGGTAPTMGGGGGGGTPPVVILVSAIIVNQETLTLTVGGNTGTLAATVSPADATDKSVTWSSSNEVVATVADGIVTPLTVGTAIITVTTDDGSFTATSEVTVSYNGLVSGQITSSNVGVVTGTLDFLGEDDLIITGAVTGVGNLTTFEGTVSGSIDGTIEAQINANGIDTLSGTILLSSGVAADTIRIIGIFGQTGIDGDFAGEIITGPVPTYVETMEITSAEGATVTVGDTLQLAVGVTPERASSEVIWSVYVNDRLKGSIDDEGLFTALAPGTVTVIAKALDGSLKDDIFVVTVDSAM